MAFGSNDSKRTAVYVRVSKLEETREIDLGRERMSLSLEQLVIELMSVCISSPSRNLLVRVEDPQQAQNRSPADAEDEAPNGNTTLIATKMRSPKAAGDTEISHDIVPMS